MSTKKKVSEGIAFGRGDAKTKMEVVLFQ